jgi:F420-non-reducing hydrogenase iron-sulfur subunit
MKDEGEGKSMSGAVTSQRSERPSAAAVSRPKDSPWEPKIVAFLCNWCSYAGADLAGTSRIQYPSNVRIIRVPCSGRIDPLFILASLQKGTDGVLVSGCHPGECHYLTGNYSARRKFSLLKGLLEHVGLDEGRVQFSWVSASEGVRFAKVVREVTTRITALGPLRKLVKAIPGDASHVANHGRD